MALLFSVLKVTLYGVTMQEKGVSKLLELQSAELAAQMGLE